VWIVYGLLSFSTALRIAGKATKATSTMRAATTDVTAPPDPDALGQSFGVALALLLAVPCMAAVLLRGDDRPAVVAVLLVPMILGSVWAWVDFASRLRRFRRDRTVPIAVETPPGQGAWSRRILLMTMLGFSALLTTGPLTAEMIGRGNPRYAASPRGLRHLEASRGMQPALALLFLGMTIRPLTLARRSMPRWAWLGMVAFALLLTMIDVAACLAYLGSLIVSG
jgi:hypothetical protein